CSTGSMHGGESYDRGILEQITKQTGIPSVSVASSVIQALKVLRVKKVAVTTPYAEELNQVEKRFLESVGFEITDIEGLDIIDAFEIGHLRPEDAYIRGSKIDSPEADGIFISCTNWQSIEIIDMLERDLGKPVITSNQSTFWAALKKSGIHQPIEGFGSLLKEH
ncbi:MAG: maleate cis-trans isomerase, partial [Nitrososphaeria archaeon]|nr:maleate cis-trans isomerase [Nitrososphaeria archaeon]NIN53471.1 maleate cis-trans isomerase [Nitrososphaeria archaeon]NIQ33988.1 maleate cis-trans isomerase [Nitrososphaeria archaeon]